MPGYSGLTRRIKNMVVGGGLTCFVAGVYIYTMRAVGGTDELQAAIDTFEKQERQKDSSATVESTQT